jgi:hypothetical protein
MITFRQHLEISKNSSTNESIIEYIRLLSPEDKVSVSRSISDTYPLDMSWNEDYKIHNSFNTYTDPMELVLGQFIMVEQIITGKTKFETEAENDLALAKLLIRPRTQQVFDNENPAEEQSNEHKILNTPVQEVYSVLSRFLDKREFVLFKQFAGVFYETPEEDVEEGAENSDPTGESLFAQQWYWYSMVRLLAKEDITKYDDIYMLKMSTVMPEMSFLAQKRKIESANQRQQQAMRKL